METFDIKLPKEVAIKFLAGSFAEYMLINTGKVLSLCRIDQFTFDCFDETGIPTGALISCIDVSDIFENQKESLAKFVKTHYDDELAGKEPPVVDTVVEGNFNIALDVYYYILELFAKSPVILQREFKL